MLVAVCDQFFGTSTSSWRKIVTPFSLPLSAVRFSHSTASNGEIFPSVKYLSKGRPWCAPAPEFSLVVSVIGEFPVHACFTVAILPSTTSSPLFSGQSLILLHSSPRGAGRALKIHGRSKPSIRWPDRRKRRPLGSPSFYRPPRGHHQNHF